MEAGCAIKSFHLSMTAFYLLMMISPRLLAQEEANPPGNRNEFCFGMGVVSPLEQHPFNTPGEFNVGTSVGVNLAYLYDIDPQFALGAPMVGYFVKTPPYAVQNVGTSNVKTLRFDLASLNLSGEARYTFLPTDVKPYVFGIVGVVSGSVQNDQTGTLNNLGFSVGGASFTIGTGWKLAIEGLAIFGSATWKQKPFQNSSGTAYNPSMIGVLGNISYSWGA